MRSTAQPQDPFADQTASLRWTAVMITGDAELVERSIIDATSLAQTRSPEFRDWLVLWAHLATARSALSAVRASLQHAARHYADCAYSHYSHEPLTMADVQALQKLDTTDIIQQLDPLARALLVLRGCHGAMFNDCMFLLNVPLHSAVAAYCIAVEWFRKRVYKPDDIRELQPPERGFSMVRARWPRTLKEFL